MTTEKQLWQQPDPESSERGVEGILARVQASPL